MPKLAVAEKNLNLDIVLFNEQTFRFKRVYKDKQMYYYGVARHRVWKIWRVNEDEIEYEVLHSFIKSNEDTDKDVFNDFFSLQEDFDPWIDEWKKDSYFKKLYENNPAMFGIRILTQDVFENLFLGLLFLKTPTQRIYAVIEKFCKVFGTRFKYQNMNFYSFPTVEHLTKLKNLKKTLTDNQFELGRNDFAELFIQVKKAGGSKFLDSLKDKDVLEARKELMQFWLVGRKSADFILLKSLKNYEVVPSCLKIKVLISDKYKLKLDTEKFVSKDVKFIYEFLNEKFDEYSGWIQNIFLTLDK
uniref:OGG_N domain-containing protein n=1 Tax=Rhabditophanes sp. KR3021 TaxID=114890 RepID=A0AC35TRU2_9BILA